MDPSIGLGYLQNQIQHKNLDGIVKAFFCARPQFAAFFIQSCDAESYCKYVSYTIPVGESIWRNIYEGYIN